MIIAFVLLFAQKKELLLADKKLFLLILSIYFLLLYFLIPLDIMTSDVLFRSPFFCSFECSIHTGLSYGRCIGIRRPAPRTVIQNNIHDSSACQMGKCRAYWKGQEKDKLRWKKKKIAEVLIDISCSF